MVGGSNLGVRARFSAPIQACPGTYPAFHNEYRVSFTVTKRSGRGVDHSHPSRADVKEGVQLYLSPASRPSYPVLGWSLPYLTFYLNRRVHTQQNSYTTCSHLAGYLQARTCLYARHKRAWENGDTFPLVIDIGTRCGWVVSFTPWPLYAWGNNLSYLLDMRLGWPQQQLPYFEKRTKVLPL